MEPFDELLDRIQTIHSRHPHPDIRSLRAHDGPSRLPHRVGVIIDILGEALDRANDGQAEANALSSSARDCHMATEFVLLRATVAACVTMLREERRS